MRNIARDQETVQSLALSDLLSSLDLSKETQLLTYKVLFPEILVNDREIQERHQEMLRKIVNWPRDENNEVRVLVALERNLLFLV